MAIPWVRRPLTRGQRAAREERPHPGIAPPLLISLNLLDTLDFEAAPAVVSDLGYRNVLHAGSPKCLSHASASVLATIARVSTVAPVTAISNLTCVLLSDIGGWTWQPSEDRQVILPKAIRERRNWAPGTRLVVEETADGVLLKMAPVFAPTRPEDVAGMLAYRGPPKTLEEMDAAITAEVKRRRARGRY